MNQKFLTEENFNILENYIQENKSETMGLMPVLHKAQDTFGCIPLEVQKFISSKMDIPVAEIYGVVTFYSRFSTEPVGDYLVSVCMGTACYVKGAQKILDEFSKQMGMGINETSEDGKFTLLSTRCVGACGLAPIVTVNDDVYGKATQGDVLGILKNYRK